MKERYSYITQALLKAARARTREGERLTFLHRIPRVSFMNKHREKRWIRFLILIYGLAFFFLLVAGLVTAYLLSNPQYHVMEKTPFIRALFSKYGLIAGVLLAILYNYAAPFLILLCFTLYLKFKKRYEWNNILTDSIVYSCMSAFGLYIFIFWLLDATNDVYWLLRTHPHVILATLELWSHIGYLAIAIFFVLFLIVYYSTRKREEEKAR